jgi:hypothetical protein
MVSQAAFFLGCEGGYFSMYHRGVEQTGASSPRTSQ